MYYYPFGALLPAEFKIWKATCSNAYISAVEQNGGDTTQRSDVADSRPVSVSLRVRADGIQLPGPKTLLLVPPYLLTEITE